MPCIRSLMKKSSTVWHSMLTEENVADVERIKIGPLKIILEEKYEDYQNALNITEMETLVDRREALWKNFALKNVKMKKHFIRNTKAHEIKQETLNIIK